MLGEWCCCCCVASGVVSAVVSVDDDVCKARSGHWPIVKVVRECLACATAGLARH